MPKIDGVVMPCRPKWTGFYPSALFTALLFEALPDDVDRLSYLTTHKL